VTGSRTMAAPEPAAGPGLLCLRYGAAGPHYLTCPSLRLPADYRLSEDPRPSSARALTFRDVPTDIVVTLNTERKVLRT
jgi:hypothetical protein